MKAPFLVVSAMVLVSCGAALAQEDAVKKELAKMEGVWQFVSAEEDGKPLADVIVQNLKFVFKGDELTFKGDDNISKKAGKIRLKIDASTTPKCLDFKVEAGEKKDTLMEGIYEWKGDELRICACLAPGNRPTAFETKEGSGRVLFVLKREKT